MAGFQIGQWVPGSASSGPQTIAVPAGSLVLTGYAPTVRVPRTLPVPAGSLVLTGYAPTVNAPYRVSVPAGGLVLTAFAPIVRAQTTLSVPAGSLTLTGFAPTVRAPATLPVPAGSLVLTGYAPTVKTPYAVAVPSGNITLTGLIPTVRAPAAISVPVGSLVLTGFAPTVLTGGTRVIDVPAGGLILTGYAPDVLAGTTAAAASGPTPAGSKRGRKPKQYFVEWRGRLYQVQGERDGVALLQRLRAQESEKLDRTVPKLARRAVKKDSPPPVEAPSVTVSGDVPQGIAKLAAQVQAQMAEEYRRKVETAYIQALEWRVARLTDDNEGLLALLVGTPEQSEAMQRAREVAAQVYRVSKGTYRPDATRVYMDTLAWQASWLSEENETLEALVLDDD
jgi:hypothetical protein